MKLQQLHEQFIEKANRRMTFGGLPVQPKEPEAPVIALERWRQVGGVLCKTYRFRRILDRNSFVMQLMSYEVATEHNASLRIDHDTVEVTVQTRDIGNVTELDREYARYADVVFKDLVYNLSYGTEG